MATEHQRIAWLRLALAQVLSCPDVKTARMAEAALDTDDREMRLAATAAPPAPKSEPKENPWLAED
jgi:hypothetical protein